MTGKESRRFGIHAEVALKSILEGLGAIVMRTSMSHGPFDLLALGDGDIALIEVKATNGVKFYPSKSAGTVEAIGELARIAAQCAPNVVPVVAIYWGRADEFRFYTPERILAGPVRPEDSDFDFALAPLPPKPSSPPTTSPPRSEEGARASETGKPIVDHTATHPSPHESPPQEPTPAMREAADTV